MIANSALLERPIRHPKNRKHQDVKGNRRNNQQRSRKKSFAQQAYAQEKTSEENPAIQTCLRRSKFEPRDLGKLLGPILSEDWIDLANDKLLVVVIEPQHGAFDFYFQPFRRAVQRLTNPYDAVLYSGDDAIVECAIDLISDIVETADQSLGIVT